MNMVHENQERMKLNGPHQLLVYAIYAYLLGEPNTQRIAQSYKVRSLQAFSEKPFLLALWHRFHKKGRIMALGDEGSSSGKICVKFMYNFKFLFLFDRCIRQMQEIDTVESTN